MFPSQTSNRERFSVYRAPIYSVQVPGKRISAPGSLAGPVWREMPISRAFLYISFSTPVKELSLHAPLHRAPINRSSVSRALLHLYLKVPGKTSTPSRLPNGSPLKSGVLFASFLLHISRCPQSTRSPGKTKSHLPIKVPYKGAPSPWSPNGAPMETILFQSQWFIHSLISLRVPI